MENKFHKHFQFNGKSFDTVNEILEFTSNISTEIHTFLQDWFSNRLTITVQTSGSTGTPKSIELQKKHMINSAFATAHYFDLPAKTTALLCLPITYIAGKMMLIRAINIGWHLDIVEATLHPLKNVTKSYDFSAMVPLQLENSLDKIDGIKKLIVGGGVVSNQLQQKLQKIDCHVFATYGMTETITHIAVKKLNHVHKYPNFYEVLPNVTIYKDQRNCLVIEAKNVAEKVLFTNDVVQLISHKKFDWLGRFDNVINSGGIKLHPETIEEKLAKVIENRFFVAGIHDDQLGEKLILVIESLVKIENETLTKMELFSKIKSLKTLSKFEIPKEIYFINSFTETTSGKIQRKKNLEKLGF
ncbi:AMP-binding protein [Polaribacter gangjinensis]|uniref:O-succinylbenzoic acid--CoA ligase n=1 Tax=Polaribacter gangjinensis TaxID=574710 RepID=A0A2S7W9B0_9FLAO|nr:AMP-binding protein [Polaribacter gangjinensis]PQJ74225.1 O-succinylbenzoic acid--CoA ligase [Polaribacter gangjinensis]